MIAIRYAQIREIDVSNGEGIGVALFVQGCRFRCPNCFNPETWDFNGGKEWTEEIEDEFIELANRPYIKRISILGGEPLADENLNGMLNLLNKIRFLFGNTKKIWLYTGYQVGIKKEEIEVDDFWNDEDESYNEISCVPMSGTISDYKRKFIAQNVDVVVDGQYKDAQRDINLSFRGSSNQRVIDIEKSLQKGEVVLWKC